MKALLAVSFGTSYRDTLERNIAAIERDLAAALPGRTLYRAFTSGMILKKLRERDGLVIPSPQEALTALLAQGCDDVVIQPTHLMNGDEYDKLCAQAAPFRGRFKRLVMGKPLLSGAGDYAATAEALLAALPVQDEGRAVVLMGHGSAHFANSAYALLEYVLHDLGRGDILVGTVEGYPALAEVLRRLEERPKVKRVDLFPLMIVAGDHARNDMAGSGGDAWKTRLESLGYEVTCHLMGLGEYAQVRALFVQHAKAAEEEHE